MITVTRRLSVVVAVLALAAAGAGCGRSGGGGDDDVASIDENAAATTEEPSDDGGGSTGPDSQEFQDAALEYAQCMRDHGIDIPDPTFDGDGGFTQIVPEGEGGGPEGPSDEFQAADDECRSIMEDALPEPEDLSPEEVAERQDQLLAMAQCMRDKGYDMPDPEVDSSGRVTIGRRGGPADGGSGTGPPADEDQFREDMEACQDEAGMDLPAGGPAGSRRSDG
jgi:hypothetical protein